MTASDPPPSVRGLVASASRRTTVVLVAATVLSVLFRYVGSREFAVSELGADGTSAARWHFASAFVLLGVIPAALARFVLGLSLADLGVRLGDLRAAAKALAVLVPLFVLLSFSASRQAPFRAEYPLDPGAAAGAGPFALHAAAYLLLYYTAWEFCFRGFVQVGLRDAMGDWNAILVQTSLSTVMHVGKPLGETLGAVAGGILWGVVVVRTRSLLAGVVSHFALGIALDLFLVTR